MSIQVSFFDDSNKYLNHKAKLFSKGNKGDLGDHPFTEHMNQYYVTCRKFTNWPNEF